MCGNGLGQSVTDNSDDESANVTMHVLCERRAFQVFSESSEYTLMFYGLLCKHGKWTDAIMLNASEICFGILYLTRYGNDTFKVW